MRTNKIEKKIDFTFNYKIRNIISKIGPFISSILFTIFLLEFIFDTFISRINWSIVFSDFGWLLLFVMGLIMFGGMLYAPIIVMSLKTNDSSLENLGSVILVIGPILLNLLPSTIRFESSFLIICLVALVGFWAIKPGETSQGIDKNQKDLIGDKEMRYIFIFMGIFGSLSFIFASIYPIILYFDIVLFIFIFQMNLGIASDLPKSIKKEEPSSIRIYLSNRKLNKLTPVEYIEQVDKAKIKLRQTQLKVETLLGEINAFNGGNLADSKEFDKKYEVLQGLLSDLHLQKIILSELEDPNKIILQRFAYFEYSHKNFENSLIWAEKADPNNYDLNILNLKAENYVSLGQYEKALWQYLVILQDLAFPKVVNYERLGRVLVETGFNEASKFALVKNIDKLCASLHFKTYQKMRIHRKSDLIRGILSGGVVIGIVLIFILLRVFDIIPALPLV